MRFDPLGLLTLLAGVAIAVTGLGCLILGGYGLMGGSIIAAFFALMGAGMLFVGSYCGLYGYRECLKPTGGKSEDSVR
jgi:hypothetical protein